MDDIPMRIQRRTETTTLPAQITLGSTTNAFSGPLVTAEAPGSFVVSIITGSNGVQTKTVIPAPEATSIASATTKDTASASRSTASTTSSDASKSSSNNLNTLIPAIVAPVAAVLVFSFIGFWLFMRRRQKKALASEPEFVMEGMKEKPKHRPITADSNSSTQELVPTKMKEAAVNIREVERPPMNPAAIGKETTFAPPRLGSAMGSRPGSRQADGRPRAVPNFSRGPRPNTQSRDITASPGPGYGQEGRGGSRAGHRPPPSAMSNPGLVTGIGGPERVAPPPAAITRPSQPRQGSFSRPLGPSTGLNRIPPKPLTTKPSRSEGSDADGNVYQPTAGAYNGSSPISQYSPIVKEMPKFGTAPMNVKQFSESKTAGSTTFNDQGTRKAPPSAIKTGNSPMTPADARFSDENVRTARLANNTRLGFHSMIATTAATSPATEEPPTPSPRLPPPATRDAPPTNYNIPLPAHEPPAPARIQARLNGASISDRRSVVSGLSDDYVDMEVDDNKSDVSSLDEREKWQIQSENDRANSRQAGLGGYGGLGARPPMTSADSHTSDTSQYSLGYYSKGSGQGPYR